MEVLFRAERTVNHGEWETCKIIVDFVFVAQDQQDGDEGERKTENQRTVRLAT